jgi:uncharacterized phage-associated protein
MRSGVGHVSVDANDVASYLMTCVGESIEAMKLEKLVYYSQAWHLAVFNEPLFEDRIEAWANGPVVRALYEQHRGRRWVHSWAGNRDVIAPHSRGLVSLVCKQYAKLSGDELSDLTHSESPWLEARGNLPDGARGQGEISASTMASYYRSRRTLGGCFASDLAAGSFALPGASSSREPADTPVIGLGQQPLTESQRALADKEGFRPSRLRG